MHPGSSAFGAFKRWPASHFAELAKMIHETRGMQALILWGPGERPIAEEIAAFAPRATIISCAWPTLLSLAAVAERARFYVGADTGPTYIFWAAGCPTVALFGPKPANIYAPRGRNTRIVTTDVPCRPCSRRQCANPVCMTKILPADVFQACMTIMEENSHDR